MKSLKRGKNTLPPEVTNISSHGFWILVEAKEYFLPFELFPWFENATLKQISHIQTFDNNHLYWPELDVDLSLKIIQNPKKYKLVSK